MSEVLRSVKVILQNSTYELLTVEGFDTFEGTWSPNLAPQQGAVVEKQSAQHWMTESREGGVGTGAYLRLGSTKGYVRIDWELTWCGPFRQRVEAPPGLFPAVTVFESQPDFPVLFVTLYPHP